MAKISGSRVWAAGLKGAADILQGKTVLEFCGFTGLIYASFYVKRKYSG
ncbi:MAG: hypothetical protein Q4G07_04365 [Oscillospiraceae bacterium]|nr:hypothetical protein [Oscillospiraceae bacterium]